MSLTEWSVTDQAEIASPVPSVDRLAGVATAATGVRVTGWLVMRSISPDICV
jgi:hypothetical protein